MNKKIILAITLTILPTSHPIQAHSYVKETIAAVGTITFMTILGALGWKSLTYSQQENDKNCIHAVTVIDPEKDLSEICVLFKKALVTQQSVGEVLAQHCATHGISAQDLCSKLTSYTQKVENALARLKTNEQIWSQNNHELALPARAALNNQKVHENINTLSDMCKTLTQEKEYAQIYCGYHTIATHNYLQSNKQFYLVSAVNDLTQDLEKSVKLLQKLDQLTPNSSEQQERYMQLKKVLKEKTASLRALHEKIIKSREYLEQKSSHFIFEQQQSMIALEQGRVAAEKAKTEKERLEIQYLSNEKNRDWAHLNNKVKTLTETNKKLNEEKTFYIEKLNENNESLNALRIELESLKSKYAALEKIKAQLVMELSNVPAASTVTEEHKKIELELQTLKDKIRELQRKIANPPFNPSSPEMVVWLKQSVTELLV